jgi:hypothetical protein
LTAIPGDAHASAHPALAFRRRAPATASAIGIEMTRTASPNSGRATTSDSTTNAMTPTTRTAAEPTPAVSQASAWRMHFEQ